MFFLGQLNGQPPIAQIQADLIGLITGQITDLNQLASIWVPGSIKLVNIEPAGWELHDPAAGVVTQTVTPKVIKAPWSDDPTKFKYINIGAHASSNNNLTFVGYETWNATTHVGTNPQGSLTFEDWHNLSFRGHANTWILLSVSKNHLLVVSSRQISGSQVFGSTYDYFFASEFSRDDAWNRVENGYPAWFSVGCFGGSQTNNTSNNGALSRWLNTNNPVPVDQTNVSLIDSNSSTGVRLRLLPQLHYFPNFNTTACGLESLSFMGLVDSSPALDANKQQTALLVPLRLGVWSPSASLGAHQFGSVSAKAPFVYHVRGVWAMGDEFDIGGDRYFCLRLHPSSLFIKEA